jgi:hypothetical protein
VNCYQHPDLSAVAFCRSCGRGLCESCRRPAEGTVFCQDHVPLSAYEARRAQGVDSNPYAQPAAATVPVQTSPGLAFLVGLIPGVGAIYNGQYLKGFVHVAILGVLISIVSSGHVESAAIPFVGLLIGIWYCYMPFEAYHTAKKRQAGVPVDEWSSLMPRSMARGGRLPVGPVVLIVLGSLFLLDNLGFLPFSVILRFWPLLLIGLGIYSLYSKLSQPSATIPPVASGPVAPAPPTDAMGVPREQ